MNLLEGLNPSQRAAVEETNTHVLVVAGAGSGKTRVLTRKIAYLLAHVGVAPYQILAMTFSNKAANEMKERLAHMLPGSEQPRSVGTFHATCLRILKEYHVAAGLESHFSIYDTADQQVVLKKALDSLGFDPKQFVPKVLLSHLDRAKNETMHPIPYLRNSQKLSDRAVDVLARYEEILQANSALDFGSLMTKTLELLQKNPDIQESLHRRWPRILIDEYQDTNRIQKELILALSGPQTVVCAVGDEDQSIYGWRGARVENMLEFLNDFPNAQLIKLEQNYRSTQRILDVANHVISHNDSRRDKALWTQNAQGEKVLHFHLEDDYKEAKTVVDHIRQLLNRQEVSLNEVAVFYRTHAQSRLLEEECRSYQLPYKIFGGTKFFDRQEIKDALSFLKLFANPSDNVAFLRVINLPSRGIGPATLDQLAEKAQQSQSSLLQAINHISTDKPKKAEKALLNFHRWFTDLRPSVLTARVDEAMEWILKQTGYLDALTQENSVEAESRVENLEELLRSMKEYHDRERGDVLAYLDKMSLYSDTDTYDAQAPALSMMTLHNSKGLEFDAVFMVGMEEGVFPHQRSLDAFAPKELEEERRLCYVGMTRAKKRLFLTSAMRRALYREVQYYPVSRFISEIPAEHLDVREDLISPKPLQRFGATPRAAQTSRPPTSASAFSRVAQSHMPYPPGTKIQHPSFGQGIVLRCDGNPENLKLTVNFKAMGQKQILLNYCSVEILS